MPFRQVFNGTCQRSLGHDSFQRATSQVYDAGSKNDRVRHRRPARKTPPTCSARVWSRTRFGTLLRSSLQHGAPVRKSYTVPNTPYGKAVVADFTPTQGRYLAFMHAY